MAGWFDIKAQTTSLTVTPVLQVSSSRNPIQLCYRGNCSFFRQLQTSFCGYYGRVLLSYIGKAEDIFNLFFQPFFAVSRGMISSRFGGKICWPG